MQRAAERRARRVLETERRFREVCCGRPMARKYDGVYTLLVCTLCGRLSSEDPRERRTFP